jgi:murein DD-endopeptidase MepM/ murein hydrolase activator NlpD
MLSRKLNNLITVTQNSSLSSAKILVSYAIIFILLLLNTADVTAFSQDVVWPISGTSEPDMPFSSTFGPRLKASEDYRYDYHRGIDIPVPVGTPVHAIASGTVRMAGNYKVYPNGSPLVQIRHKARSGSYIYSNYMHLDEWIVQEGDQVNRGDIIGFVGVSDSGFPHLHFEIREGGIYQKDCIHPLRWLPYNDTTAHRIVIDSKNIPRGSSLQFTVILPPDELDLKRVEINIYGMVQGRQVKIDERFFDMEEYNSWYKDPKILDNPEINGFTISPARFNAGSKEYEITFLLHELPDTSGMSFEIKAIDVMGNSVKTKWSDSKTRYIPTQLGRFRMKAM